MTPIGLYNIISLLWSVGLILLTYWTHLWVCSILCVYEVSCLVASEANPHRGVV